MQTHQHLKYSSFVLTSLLTVAIIPFLIESPTEFPSFSPTASPSISPKLATNVIISKKSLIEQNVLKSYTASGQPYPSITYTFGGFLDALQKMKNEDLDADLNFKLWDEHKTKYRLGLINVAAFLASK